MRTGAAAGLLFLVALVIFGGAAKRVPYWGDENDCLIAARYFRYLFIDHDILNPDWGDSYWTHTHPMLTRYLVGGWLWARGYSLDPPLRRYDFSISLADNNRKGRIPSDALISEARVPMVWLAAGSVVLLYLLGSTLGGAVAGLTAATLALASPLAGEHLVRAMTDGPLAFFLLLSTLLGVVVARRALSDAGSFSFGWSVALGVGLGLALATKLTAFLGLLAVLVWVVLVAVTAGRGAARGWLLAVAIAVAVFVASDPHLYPNPIVHTLHLFQERMGDEMLRQREAPRSAVRRPLDRPGLVVTESLVDGTITGSHGVPLEAGLATVGVVALLAKGWRGWRQTGRLQVEGFVLLTALVYYAGISANLYNFNPRYLLPTFLLGALLSGVGLAVIVRWFALTPRSALTPTSLPSRERG